MSTLAFWLTLERWLLRHKAHRASRGGSMSELAHLLTFGEESLERNLVEFGCLVLDFVRWDAFGAE